MRRMLARQLRTKFDLERSISLSELARVMKVHDRMPMPIQAALCHSIKVTLATNLIFIPLMLVAPYILAPLYPVESFFFYFTGDAVTWLLSFANSLSTYLLFINIISLAITGGVVIASRAFTRPVVEHLHWMAWAAAFPTGLSILSVAVMAGLLLVVIVLTVVIWIVITVLIIFGVIAVVKLFELYFRSIEENERSKRSSGQS